MLPRKPVVAAGVALALWALGTPSARAISAQSGLVVNGTTLTATTSNAVATFNRADLVGFQNILTGENYLRLPSNGDLAAINTIASTGQSLQASNWAIGAEPGTGHTRATMTLTDSVRSMLVAVKVDPDTQEIVLKTTSAVATPGLRSASWSLAGLDLEDGRLLVPSRTGQVLDRVYPGTGSTYNYPDHWNAQMVVYEAGAGSVIIYSTDQTYSFKRMQTSTRGHMTIDVSIGTEARGPYSSATGTPEIEWRLKAFSGDWQVAATAYRTWLNANRPPTSAAAYPWVSSIRAVVTVIVPDTNVLAPLASVLVPSETLLYLVQWRSDAYDVDYPDYTPAPSAAPFVNAARALGFRVMLHTDLIGVSPSSPDYPGVQAFHARHPETLQPLGWKWEMPPSTPYRFAYINPAAAAYRNLFLARVGVAVAALQPDALHLDISSPTFNDGNGIIEGRNYPAGVARLHQDLQAAFPTIALGGEGENDVTFPYQRFAQVLTYMDPVDTPPPGHALTAFLFAPTVQFYGHLATPLPTEVEFKRWFIDTTTRGSLPTLKVNGPGDVAMSNPDIARLVGALQNWQAHDFQLATGDWQGTLARWNGNAGATAVLSDQGNLLTLIAAGSTLVQLSHGANQAVTPRFSPGWPAFDQTTLYGLDPGRHYWLDAMPRPDTTHATSLPLGVKVGPATSIGARFARIAVASEAAASFDAVDNLLDGQTGVRFQGIDGPLGNGAVVHLSSIAAGGVTRQGLFIHPPYQGQVGGETFIQFPVPVPSAALLRFGVGVADNATCTDGVTFRVSVNGADLWSQHLTRTGWQDVSLSLAAYGGSTVAVRLTSHPGPANNAGCDWAVWSPTRLEPVPTGQTISVPIALGPGAVYSGFSGQGLATAAGSSVSVTNVPVPGAFTVFTSPGSTVAAGTSLTALPFEAWLAGRDELARLGSLFDSGTLSSGWAGGVFKSPTINAHPPNNGRTTLSWTLQLPAGAPLRLGWNAGILDGGATLDGVDFEVRVNGVAYWRLTTSANQWNAGSLNLSAWQGQLIVLELVTDSRATYNFDWAHWADLVLTAASGCTYSLPGGTTLGASGGSSLTFGVTAPVACPWLATPGAPWISVADPASGLGNGTVTYNVLPNWGAPRTGAIAVSGQTFTVTQAAGSANAIQNGAFDGGLAGWNTFATPDSSYIVTSIVGGVLEFYRQPPPPQTTNQATVFQNTGMAVSAGAGVEARFDLGNSSTARKRVSVLVLDSDFSDLFVCTFWLAPGAPLRTYRMRTHTNEAWQNASIYFYAATAGAAGGAYQIDNVSLHVDPAVSGEETGCVDPTAPAPVAIADGPSLLVNGDFTAGLAPWGVFGQITGQVTAGVFEFFRPAGTPAGVVLQNTAQAIPANEIVTATFELGNSSPVRKRVTVLLHDNSFSDLAACTFWLPAGQPLSPYVMRSFTTQAWTAATLSVYPATVGTDAWIQLDNASLRRTPSTAIVGTECVEPAPSTPPSAAPSSPGGPARGTPPGRPPAGSPARSPSPPYRGR